MEEQELPFFLLADPRVGNSHWTLIGPRCPTPHPLGVSGLEGDLKEVTGYFRSPWGTGVANPSGEPPPAASPRRPPAPRSPLPASPTHVPSPGEPPHARRSLPRSWQVCALRETSKSRLECVWLCRAARDTEPGIMKEILRWLSPHQIKGKLSVRLANNTCYCSSPARHFIKRYNHFNIHASPQPFHPPPRFSSSLLFNIFYTGKCLSCISWELAFPPGSRCFGPQHPGNVPLYTEKRGFSLGLLLRSPLHTLPPTAAPFSFK